MNDIKASGKILIGLTGNFGSGKSTVSHFFEELGAFVIDADHIAHEALQEGNELYRKIASLFKEAQVGAAIDRKKLAAIIFKDAARRKQLEDLIHPYVLTRLLAETADAEEHVVVAEVALLFESGFDAFCDQIIVVTASESEIRKRLREKGFSEEEIELRQKAQLSMEEKTKRAGLIIDNSGNLETTRREVEKIWKDIRPVLKKGEK